MRVLTITELMHLTRIELCDLVVHIKNKLPEYPEYSEKRLNAFTNLRNIRTVMALRGLTP